MKLSDLLYTVPLVGGIKFYRDIKRYNRHIEDSMTNNPDTASTVRERLIKLPIFEATMYELIGDVIYGISGGTAFLLHSTGDSLLAKAGIDVALGLPSILLNYFIKSIPTRKIRDYKSEDERDISQMHSPFHVIKIFNDSV